jgi:hypothetical protein
LKNIIEKEEKNLKDLEENFKNFSSLDFQEELYLKIKEAYFNINISLKEKNEEIHEYNISKSKIEFEIKDFISKIESHKKDSETLK